jgi:hypothetical protein
MTEWIDYEDISRSEHEWLKYLISREYQPAISRFIVEKSKLRYVVEYMGAYYISLKPNFANKFTRYDERQYNLDIIYLDGGSSTNLTQRFGIYQTKFSSLLQFAKIRRPSKKIGAYFFAELHDEKGFLHWNIAFLFPEDDQIYFFDPNMSKKYTGEYDFHSRKAITAAFSTVYGTNIKQEMFLATIPPQFICETGTIGVDRFCQTWVLLFLDIFCNNFVESFLMIDFEKYQTLIVKTWIICILDRMAEEQTKKRKKTKKRKRDEYEESVIWTDKGLKYFPYCAIVTEGEYTVESAIKCIRDIKVKNCAEMVIARFLWQDLGK